MRSSTGRLCSAFTTTRHSTSKRLKGDPGHLAQHLAGYIKGFSTNVRRIFEYFEFDNEIEKMREANIL